jgi:hypothetical protein
MPPSFPLYPWPSRTHRSSSASARLRAPLSAAVVGTLAVVAGCMFFPTTQTRIIVAHTPAGDRAFHEEGRTMPMNHWDLETGGAGLKRGFFVVKSEFEWRSLWPNTEADKIPILPQDLDLSKEMLLVATPPEPTVLAAEVKEVVDTEVGKVHVYLAETTPGQDCPAGEKDVDAKNYDLTRVRRVDHKDVIVHIDSLPRPPCGDPPKVVIRCRANGSTSAYEEKLTVGPSAAIGCVAQDVKSLRPIFDLTWTFASLPSATFAKLLVSQGAHGASFVTDVFGTYKLALEVTDDLQRKGTAAAEISVAPPNDSLVLQFVWTKFDPSDDPTTFPRIELHALGINPPDPPKKGLPKPLAPIKWGTVPDCALESDKSPPAWCTTRAVGPTTIMTIDPSAAKDFAVALHYTDERFPGQPIACVRSYRNGTLQAELCDPQARKEGWWEAGTLDSVSGKTPEGLAQDKAAAAAAARAAEAKAAEIVAAAKAAEAARAAALADAGAGEGGMRSPSSSPEGGAGIMVPTSAGATGAPSVGRPDGGAPPTLASKADAGK